MWISKWALLANAFSAVLIVGSGGMIFFTLPPRAEPVFLHYTIYYGIDLIGSWWLLFLMPGSGLAIFILNLVLAAVFWTRNRVLSYFLIFSTTAIEVILAFGILLILLQNST